MMKRVRNLALAVLVASCSNPSSSLSQLPSAPFASPSVADPLAQARRLLDQNKPAEAEPLLRRQIATPGSAEAHFLLGLTLFREIQALGSQSGAGNIMFAKMRDEKARESLAEYTAGAGIARPGAFELKIVAFDYILLEAYTDAEKWLMLSLASDAADEQSWYYLGRIRYKKGDYPEAAKAFRHALALSPRDTEAEDNLGLALEDQGQTESAITAYKTAIGWAGNAASRNGPWLDLGALLLRQQHASEALPYLVRAEEISPEDTRAHEQVAEAYKALGRWPDVQAQLIQAVALSPDSASLHFLLGQAYRRNNLPDKAQTEFEASAALHARQDTKANSP